jgi:hypothetical protein
MHARHPDSLNMGTAVSRDARWVAGLLTIVVISGLVIYDAMTTPMSMITGN